MRKLIARRCEVGKVYRWWTKRERAFKALGQTEGAGLQENGWTEGAKAMSSFQIFHCVEMSGCSHADNNHWDPNTSPLPTRYSLSQPADVCFPATCVAMVILPTSHCHRGLPCQCSLPSILLSIFFCFFVAAWTAGGGSSCWPERGKTAIDL